jgi:hypothetical protein
MSDSSDLRARLAESLGPVLFSDLRAHLARGAVLVVHRDAGLLECALGVARDDVASVKAWLEHGVLARPSAEEQASWASAEGRRWLAVVVQPFVLIQDLTEPAGPRREEELPS